VWHPVFADDGTKRDEIYPRLHSFRSAVSALTLTVAKPLGLSALFRGHISSGNGANTKAAAVCFRQTQFFT
jgi:hypothetical protein